LAASLSLGTLPLSAQESALARLIHRTTLDNGLDVIVVENPAVPLATVLVAVRNGAFTQDSAEDGLAHLYEHVLFRSYRGNPTAFAFAASELNGRWNGETSEEVVCYFVVVPSKDLDDAIKLMARLVQDARFSQGDLKEERPVVLDELQRHESDPEAQLARHVARTLWGSGWSRKDVAGDSASLAGITLERLKATYARYYVPNNAALIVTGDVVSEGVFAEARRHFDEWQRRPDPFADRPIPTTTPRAASTAILFPHDVPDVTIRIALQGPSVGTDTAATYAADVLFDILDDPASDFQRRLAGDGPFQSLRASYTTLAHTGPIEVVGKTTPERAWQALAMLLAELDSLPNLKGINAEDIGFAKKRRQVQTRLTLERVAMLAPQLAFWWSSAGMDYFLSYDDRMAARSTADLRRFAFDYVAGFPRVIGVLAPPEVIRALSARLGPAARMGPP
jgi:zinc protease